jgi:hypothetical protein
VPIPCNEIVAILNGSPGNNGGYTTPAANTVEAFERLDNTSVPWSEPPKDKYSVYWAYGGLLKAYDPSTKGMGDLLAGQTRNFQFVLHLKSRGTGNADNVMQGDNVTLDKTFILTQYNCTEPGGGGGKEQKLPTGYVNATLRYCGGLNCYWTVTLSGIPTDQNYSVQNGVAYAGWCLDQMHAIGNNKTWKVKLLTSTQAYTWAVSNPEKWGFNPPDTPVFNFVNYLINKYDAGGCGASPLQVALWYFVDGVQYGDLSGQALTLVNDALLNGAGYVPDGTPTNNLSIVILIDPTGFQVTGIEVDP